MERKMISCEMITDLFKFFKEKLNLDKKVSIAVFQDPFEEYGIQYKKRKGEDIYDVLNITLPSVQELGECDYLTRDIVKDKYGIDIAKHIEGLSDTMNIVIFSLLHELSHYHRYLTTTKDEFFRISEEYKNALIELDKAEYLLGIDGERAYRDLDEEAYADSLAISVIREHKDELFDLFVTYDEDNDNLEFGVGYYEVC